MTVTTPKPRRPIVAAVSVACALPGLVLALQASRLYWLGPDNRATQEAVLELFILSLWLIPLVLGGLGLGLAARRYRLLCTGIALVAPLLWASIIHAGGGL